MINVVLVEPEGEENVGFVARSMKNMGVKNLVIVNPKCNYLSENSILHSVHAKDILENAKIYNSLDEVLKDSDISVAMTRRIGQWRKKDFYVEDLANYLVEYRDRNIYLVFGREKSGLTNDEIRSCDLICSIPSSDEFPSLNLSHAVIITLYEIFKVFQNPIEQNIDINYTIAEREEFDNMMDEIMETLDFLGFFKNVPQWRLRLYISKILLRAKLDKYDVFIIKKLFFRIRGMIKDLKKKIN